MDWCAGVDVVTMSVTGSVNPFVALIHLRIIKTHTNNNPAEIFAKYVSAETLQRHLHSVGLHVQRNPHSSF